MSKTIFDPTAEGVFGKTVPRGSTRIIYHADGHPYEDVPPHRPLHPKPADLHQYMDDIAAAGIEVVSMMGFCDGEVTWKSDLATRRNSKHPLHEPTRLRIESIWNNGLEPFDIYAKRCHENGMKLLVKFRMNDCHSMGRLTGHYNMHMGEVIQNHQEWWLNDYPGQLNYAHPGVRDWMFELAREVVQRFDIDGLTFNYIRYPNVFERAESRGNMHILTDFMRRVRAMLDEEGRKKGRKLDFCVIVAPTIEECLNFGVDVPTWIDEEIIDSVCPCHFDNSLFNTSYEEFAQLTRAKNVYLFPAVHPSISPYLYYFGYMTRPAYRAVARNIYASGADGISAFNYYSHWQAGMTIWGAGSNNGKENYPAALRFLSNLHIADNLERQDRHYVYWRGRDLSHFGFMDRNRVMTLERRVGAQAEWPICCAETFDQGTRSVVRLNAVNLMPDDSIELSVNGITISSEKIARTFHANGRTNIQDGTKLPPYTTMIFDAVAPPFDFQRNLLGIKLLGNAHGAIGDITIPEIEIAVSVGDSDPIEIMNLMVDGPYPEPLETLAGYHPDISAVGVVLMGGDLLENECIGARIICEEKEAISLGAQSFVLKSKASIGRAELCVYRIPEIREPLRLSLRADNNGVPADEPIGPGAITSFDPWEHSDQVCSHLFQGYYRFSFANPLSLDPGTYWLVLEMDPSAQPASSVRWGDPAGPSCYALVLSSNALENYPQGRYVTWNGSNWGQAEKDGKPVIAYFGVLTDDIKL